MHYLTYFHETPPFPDQSAFLSKPIFSTIPLSFVYGFLLMLLNKKNRASKGSTFGSSAILLPKTRHFPARPHGRFGFIG
jgi:hypothetical protein